MTDGLIIVRELSASGSVSPLTPSPCREIRGIRLFRAISRKLARRSPDETDVDSRSSSSDSCGSTSAGRCSRVRTKEEDSGFRSASPNHLSSSGSEAGSDVAQTRSRHHHSASAESIRKAFQGLSFGGRSQSCSNPKETKRRDGKKLPPKRILRQPVAYTYVRGLSGLPTQRVPRRSSIHGACGCGMQYLGGLHR